MLTNKLKRAQARIRCFLHSYSKNGTEHEIHCVASAAILHIDIVDSTELVRRDMIHAHRQIRHLYRRLRRICELHHGVAHELRGDAAVVCFSSADDAVAAAIAVHSAMTLINSTRVGRLNPQLRTGISYGTVISDDHMITGEPVIMAQRMEQLAETGRVMFDQSVYDQLTQATKLKTNSLGSRKVKGFDEPIPVYEASRVTKRSLSELSDHFDALSYESCVSA